MRRQGLRSSVTAFFALGALALSVTLALGTYLSARHFLVEQRERGALRQAFVNAALVRDGLNTSGTEVSEVLGSISLPSDTTIYVHRADAWFSSSLETDAGGPTAAVRPLVRAGSASLGWIGDSQPAVVVGVPLRSVDAEYYEVSIARELDDTLDTLRIALIVCAGVTTLAGALLGRAASRRVLAPLGEVTSAAARISSGEQSIRLEGTDDPDLATLVGAFNNMVDALEERVRRDARFAADVSHELRTPLTTLTNSVSLLQGAPGLSPRAQQAVTLMTTELSRFARSLEDLLTLGRIDAGVVETRHQQVPLAALVSTALAAGGRPERLLVPAGAAGDAPVVVDRQQMIRALRNLFDNADVHGDGLTAVRLVRRGPFVDVEVEDDGPGVDDADKERIFERFARAGSRRQNTGTGLGLSIVAETLRRHHGSAWCHDGPTGGTVFVARLPLAHPAGDEP